MTMAFNLQKYSKCLEKKDKPKGFDLTKSIKVRLRRKFEETAGREVKLEDIINLKIDFDEECKFNEEALMELKSNIHLLKEPKGNRCLFIENNVAWIEQEPQENIVRYFSRNKETWAYFYLDIIDIYMIITSKNYSEAVTEMLSAYNFRTQEEKQKKKNRDKYKKNISFIENCAEWKDEYPQVYKRIKGHFDTMEILNNIGLKNIHGDECVFEGKSVFFVSLRYLSDLIMEDRPDDKKICHRNIGKIVNLLCLLGFMRKLKEEDIPQKMLERGNQISKDRGWRRINYYIIYTITPKLLDTANEISKKLSEKDINLGTISYNTIRQGLGQEIAERVYPDYSKASSSKREGTNKQANSSIEITEPSDFKLNPFF